MDKLQRHALQPNRLLHKALNNPARATHILPPKPGPLLLDPTRAKCTKHMLLCRLHRDPNRAVQTATQDLGREDTRWKMFEHLRVVYNLRHFQRVVRFGDILRAAVADLEPADVPVEEVGDLGNIL